MSAKRGALETIDMASKHEALQALQAIHCVALGALGAFLGPFRPLRPSRPQETQMLHSSAKQRSGMCGNALKKSSFSP